MSATGTTVAGPATFFGDAREIIFPLPFYASLVSHAARKLAGHYLEDEAPERKAFGLLAGCWAGEALVVRAVIPLLANLRHDPRHRAAMDETVGRLAIPSETPNDQRGWIADVREVMGAERLCDEHGWMMFGNYHTHRVAWPCDPLRDTCTELDRALAAGTGLWMLIVSVVDLDRPVVRAYFEGDNGAEAAIRVVSLWDALRTHPPISTGRGI